MTFWHLCKMKISFIKYHGTGNDFIMTDNRTKAFELSQSQIAFLCDRHLGIGADGLISVSTSRAAAFSMTYFNADGREGTMCGNGGRCVAAFFADGKPDQHEFIFEAADGLHKALIHGKSGNDTNVSLQMGDVGDIRDHGDYILADTGSPHYVKFVDDIEKINVYEEGKKIRLAKAFAPGGVNVNFAQVQHGNLKLKTFERGVEDITLSCGTGTVAAAVCAHYKGWVQNNTIRVASSGGILQVEFDRAGDRYVNIRLSGPATYVFKGSIKL